MTAVADLRSADPDYASGPCPEWVAAVFAEMYPDDAMVLPTARAATVLACDEDWDWIATHAATVAGAVDGACRAVSGPGEGGWVVRRAVAGGDAFEVCTAANSTGSAHAGAGNVVLVLRSATRALLTQEKAAAPR